MNSFEKVTLEQVIKDKEARVEKIKYLNEKFKMPIVVLKLNIPGEEKNNLLFKKVFEEGSSRFSKKYNQILFSQKYNNITGQIGYFVVAMDPVEIKKATIKIEELDELGRLFDFDVYHNGKSISRRDLGFEERKCLICNDYVWNCSRSRKHSLESLLQKINKISEEAF